MAAEPVSPNKGGVAFFLLNSVKLYHTESHCITFLKNVRLLAALNVFNTFLVFIMFLY